MHDIRMSRPTAVTLGALLGVAVAALPTTQAAADTLTINATVAASCTVNPHELNFDSVDTSTGKSVETTINVQCTGLATVRMTLGEGLNHDSQASSLRRLKNGSNNFLPYKLENPSGELWDVNAHRDLATDGSGLAAFPIRGVIDPQSAVPGVYTDTVTITVTSL
jgi:spore coat protein U-like protein